MGSGRGAGVVGVGGSGVGGEVGGGGVASIVSITLGVSVDRPIGATHPLNTSIKNKPALTITSRFIWNPGIRDLAMHPELLIAFGFFQR